VEKPHKRLKVWQLAVEIVTDMYKLTESFPSEEKFGITSQMRRCAISVPSNIAEGAARNTHKEFINFLHIAQGSLAELDTQLEIALRLRFIDQETWESMDSKLLEEDKMLSGLILSIKSNNHASSTPHS
jgi:four helix bundle protein